MAVRPLVNLERLTTAHVNSVDGSMTYESGVEYKANTTVSYNGSLYTANVDIEDTDTDTPDAAPDKWSLTINASDVGTSGDISALAARVTALEDTVGDEDSGLVKDVNEITDNVNSESITRATLGTHNLLPMTLSGMKSLNTVGTWSNNVYTLNGVDFEVITDDSGSVIGIDTSGTATSDVSINVAYIPSDLKTFRLNGIVGTSAGESEYVMAVAVSAGSAFVGRIASIYNNDDTVVTYAGTDRLKVCIGIGNGYTANNLIFYPMIRLITDINSTFAPYAKSNRELTDILDYKKLADSNYGTTVADTWEYSGISVTLDKPALIAVNYSYDNTRTKGIAVCTGTDSVTTAKMSIEDSVEGSHQLVGILPTGTYYVWV